jgi:hypothetical protein
MNKLIYPINNNSHDITYTPKCILWCNIIVVYFYVCIKTILKVYIRDVLICTLCLYMYIFRILNLQIDFSILKQIIQFFKKII